MKISIIGTGDMARGIGTRIAVGKHKLIIYGRDLDKAQALAVELGSNVNGKRLGKIVDGDVVIFALPYPVILSIIEKNPDIFKEKIIVDISNPVDFQTYQLIPPPGISGAEEIQKRLPSSAKLVKAFNTTFAGTLVKGEVSGQKLDVFIAGNDEQAKNTISKIIEDGGLRPIDVGPLTNAQYLEGIQLIHISIQSKLGNSWMTTFKLLP